MKKHKIVKVEWFAPRMDMGLVKPENVFNEDCMTTNVGFLIEDTRNVTLYSSQRDGFYEHVITIPTCCILTMEVLSDNED